MRILVPQTFEILSTNVAGSTYANYSSTTTYALGAKVYIPDVGYWGEYKCLVAGTVGVDPRTSVYNAESNPSGKWEFLGVTNRYKMFDQFGNTQTVNAGTIDVSLLALDTEALFLGNLDAYSILIEVIDNATAEIIETAEFELYPDVQDWLDYFYGHWLDSNRKTQIVYERTTLTRNVSYRVKIDNGENDAKCGIMIVGALQEFGYAKLKVEMGIEDYSTIKKDTSTGATYISKGNFAKVMGFDIFTPTDTVARVYDMLARLHGTPIVATQTNFELFNVYGYFQSSKTVCENEQETAITGVIMGLI